MPFPSRLALGLLSCAAVVATGGCRRSSSDTAIDNAAKTTSAVLETLSPPPPVIVNVPAVQQAPAPIIQPPAVNVTVNVPPAQVVSTGGNGGANDTNATQGNATAATGTMTPPTANQYPAPAYAPQVVYATPAPPATAPAAVGYANGAAAAPTNPAQPSGDYTGIGGGNGYTGITGGTGYTGVGGGTGFTGVGGGGAGLTADGG